MILETLAIHANKKMLKGPTGEVVGPLLERKNKRDCPITEKVSADQEFLKKVILHIKNG